MQKTIKPTEFPSCKVDAATMQHLEELGYALVKEHVHNDWTCPSHVADALIPCTCADLEHWACNAYQRNDVDCPDPLYNRAEVLASREEARKTA